MTHKVNTLIWKLFDLFSLINQKQFQNDFKINPMGKKIPHTYEILKIR